MSEKTLSKRQEYSKRYYEEHKEERREDHRRRAREYRDKNREAALARCKEWRKNNKDRVNEYNIAYRESHKEEIKEYTRKYNERNRDRVRESCRRYRKENIEKEKIRYSNYKNRNRERCINNLSEWRKNNPAKQRQYANARRARVANVSGNGITGEQEKELTEMYAGRCAYCGSTEQLTLDHIDPISKGGSHDIENATIACKSCNSSKKDKTLLMFLYDRMIITSQEAQ